MVTKHEIAESKRAIPAIPRDGKEDCCVKVCTELNDYIAAQEQMIESIPLAEYLGWDFAKAKLKEFRYDLYKKNICKCVEEKEF